MDELNKLLQEAGIRSFCTEELIRRGTPPAELYKNIIPTIIFLQSIKDYLGRPIRINCAYRSEEYNKQVGGKPNNLHLLFNAIDFKPEGFTNEDFICLAEDIDDNKFAVPIFWENKTIVLRPVFLGVGLYENHLHIDTRGLLGLEAPRRWRG